jgi:hypothetical protein
MQQMTFREAVEVLDEFVDRFVWLATPAHGDLPDRAAQAVAFLKEQPQIVPLAGTMWTDEVLNQEVYSLTRQALDGQMDPYRVLQRFEDIVAEGYGLPIQKAYLLWESKVISIDTLLVFLESCYKNLMKLQDTVCTDELMRWIFRLLWTVTRPDNRSR